MRLGIPCKIRKEDFFIILYPRSIVVESKETIDDKPKMKYFIKMVDFGDILIKNEAPEFFVRISSSNTNKNQEGLVINPEVLIAMFESHMDRDLIHSLVKLMEKNCKESLVDLDEQELKKHLNDMDISADSLTKAHFGKTMINYSDKPTSNYTYGNFPSEITSKHQMFELLINSPLLQTVYSFLQSTHQQFFNLLTLSYFFNQKNTKNVIDRRIEEILGVEMDFASRLNIKMGEVEDVQVKEKVHNEKEIPFVPVYPFEEDENIEIEILKDFKMPKIDQLKVQLDPLEIVDVDEENEEQKEIEQRPNEIFPQSDDSVKKPSVSNFRDNLLRISKLVWQNRDNLDKREELKRLCERVESEIQDKELYKRILPSFFLSQGKDSKQPSNKSPSN
ncbi:hypothetical protein M153_12380001948 [Pseudoloma neurophilia]|uniref:Uncharacterized protein n=1 Tax=Pseudoloma neurophilia TaxID=146866 RepID=A0A0R0LUZ2_9MICR|nr:hypothetical protein M153_12380001948 [Pseudoloma neurophilia]